MSEGTAAHRAALAVEYGQYRANQPIYFDGVLAYNTGHAVPVSNVELHGYFADGLVDRVGDEPAAEVDPPKGPVDITKGQKRPGSEG